MANPLTGPNTKQQFTTVNKFLGYRSREDKTILPYGYMIFGSQNVLIDITGRLKNRPGYTLDGTASIEITPIFDWYDWEEHKNSVINLRVSKFTAGSSTSSLQFRYIDINDTVQWTTIKTGLGAEHVRFTNYWNNTELENVVLFVDGSTNVYEWNGATATYSISGTDYIEIQGTDTVAEKGFYASGNKIVVLGGIEYTYTGLSNDRFTGVTPDPTGGEHEVGDLIYQKVVTTSSITNVPATFSFEGISNVDNQIYYGNSTNNNIYISNVNNYASCAFSTPRTVGQGAIMTLRAPWVGFEPQEDAMYITAGKSQWYYTEKKLATDGSNEAFTVKPLKTSAKQAALSQEAITHDRNSIVMLTNETRLVTLGRTLNIFGTPMMTDYSYPIAKDFNLYDFTDASLAYWKSYVLVAIPRESKWLILNQTDPSNVFWEAPQTGAFSGFSIIDGDLYAHGYNVPETYKLFDGGTDNGHPILSRATFSYYDYGSRSLTKFFNEFWLDGYISANTIINVSYSLDLDGCTTFLSGNFYGNNSSVVCILPDKASLGKTSLGKHPLGSTINLDNPDSLPPYFNAIFVTPRHDFYRFSPSFESYGKDFQWEIVSFGPLETRTMSGNNNIKINLS